MLREANPQAVRSAQVAFSAAYELAPQDPRVIDGLGCVAFQQGRLDSASRYFLSAMHIDPKYDRAYAHLALVAEKKGQYGEAGRLHKMALLVNPLNYRARNNYAIFLADSDKKLLARYELTKARIFSEAMEPIIERNIRQLP